MTPSKKKKNKKTQPPKNLLCFLPDFFSLWCGSFKRWKCNRLKSNSRVSAFIWVLLLMDSVVLAASIILLFLKKNFLFWNNCSFAGGWQSEVPCTLFPFLPSSNTFCDYRTAYIEARPRVCGVLCPSVSRATATAITAREWPSPRRSLSYPLIASPTPWPPLS